MLKNWELALSRRQVELLVGDPTRITELSVPKSSELFTASGSATQREPLIIKAYSCRPGERGTETAQTTGAPARWRAVAPRAHSLKSPTSSTLAARGSTNTKRTIWTVSRCMVSAVCVGGVRDEMREPTAMLETTIMPPMPAARARPARGDTRNSRSLRHHERDDDADG